MVVDGVGDQFFTRAGFAANEYGRVPFGDLPGLVEHHLHTAGVPDQVGETGFAFDLAAQRIAFFLQLLLVAGYFVGKHYVLPDQVADHFEKAAAFTQQMQFGGRLRCQYADNFITTGADRHGKERQVGVVYAEFVEEARFVCQLADNQRFVHFNRQPHDAFACTVADVFHGKFFGTVQFQQQQIAAVAVQQADHAVFELTFFVQYAQHFAQGFLEVEGAA